MSISWPDGGTHVIDEWYTMPVGNGIVKDNLQELTIRYNLYYADLQYVENEAGVVAGNSTYTLSVCPTGTSPDATFLVAEIQESAGWTVLINGVKARLS